MSGASSVRLLDIRAVGPDRDFLDGLHRGNAHQLALVDRVIVVAETSTLLDHHDRFQHLVGLSQVRAVICVAVGPVAPDGELVLRQSAALSASGVTLWVGDEWGSRWAGGSDRPRPVARTEPPALPWLLDALSVEAVFDAVFERVRTVPYQAVCPGLDVSYPAIGAAELHRLRQHVLTDLLRPVGPQQVRVRAPWTSEDGPAPEAAAATVLPGSALATDRGAVRTAVTQLDAITASLARPLGIVAGDRSVDPAGVATAVRTQVERAEELLDRLDREGTSTAADPQLHALGVPPPERARNASLMRQLGTLVVDELRAGVSLPELGAALRRAANQTFQQDNSAARAELRAHRRAVPTALRTPAPPRLWPAPMIAVIVAACLGTLVAGCIVPTAAIPIALLWMVLGVLIVVRRPLWRARKPAEGDLAAVGAVILAPGVAVAGTRMLPPVSELPIQVLALVVAANVLLAGVVAARGWRQMVRRWVAYLRLDHVKTTTRQVNALVDNVIQEHVRNHGSRTRFSDAALLLASGLADIATVYEAHVEAGGVHGNGVAGAATAELHAVLRADLASLVRRALDKYLNAIGGDTTLSTDSPFVAGQAEADLVTYHLFLDRNGLQSTPPMVDDSGLRHDLSVALWRRSDVGLRILQCDGRGELVQLCQTADLRMLNVDWAHVPVLRFAPELVQRTLIGATDPDIVKADRDLVGVLRLMPLNPGRVRQVYPTQHAGARMGDDDDE